MTILIPKSKIGIWLARILVISFILLLLGVDIYLIKLTIENIKGLFR